eukprot:7559570-Pyramimonas_sp.AAC.1
MRRMFEDREGDEEEGEHDEKEDAESGIFELLGAPLGDADFCVEHTKQHVTNAAALREAFGGARKRAGR